MARSILFRAFILSVFFASISGAQADRSTLQQEHPTGVQITNTPEGQQRAEGAREAERTGQRPFESTEQRANQRFGPDLLHLPLEPDIEFQDYVASSLGYRLRIFGQNLFENVPSTFAPLDRVPVTPDYLIGPGDELLIRAWGQVDINYRAEVDRNGSIYLPKVGVINVAGLRYDQLTDYMRNAVGRVFKNFDLTVTLGQLRSIQVFVVGQVRRPGSYTVSSLSTLVNALFASGGPSKHGSMRRIQLKRAGKEITTFDLYDLIVRGDTSKDAQLLPGDVIYVPPVGRLVALAGSVNISGVFELKDHDTLADVIGYAGGLATTAAGQRAIVERIDDHHVREAEEFPLSDDGLKRELMDGDVVRFLHISPKFENAVTLRGNVAVPGRYPWHDGMRVKDLIPDRDFLVTEEYWKRQNRLALNPEGRTFQLLGAEAEMEEPKARSAYIGVQSQETDPNSARDQRNDQSGKLSDEMAFQRAGRTDEMASQRVDRTEAQRIKQEELKNEVKRSTAEINWEYAVIQRMNPEDLTNGLLPFNLGKAIGGDESQNLLLKPGDVITIFSQSDMQVPIGHQSKFVRLEGEFRTAGVYEIEAGETLRHLIGRVGGFTPDAYLYGAEFTRESTREDQQRRLDEYINELDKNIERRAGAQRNLNGEEAVAERQALEGQRSLLQKLRTLRASGRIVLELRPNAQSIDAFPDLVLEDGDRLLVPFRPATVNVLGAVYNSNAFVYRPGKTAGDYLLLSGGANHDGDKKRAFVIRADGTTLSGQSLHSLWMRNLTDVRLMPGDTVVVPEKLDKGALARGFKDWTQVVGQFVLGAAAVKVLLQ